jgi:hypothetical protein
MTQERQDGPWEAKEFITKYLAADMPERLVAFRNAWQLDDARLPNPVKYLSYEPIGLDEWPMINTVQMNTRLIQRVDYDNYSLDPVYRVTYNMRTYVWVRGEYAHDTTESRDRMTAVVRSALLDHPSMTRSSDIWFPSVTSEVRLDEGTLREEYSELTYVKGQRVVAGAYLAYEFSLNEPIRRMKNGDIASFDLKTVSLGDASL